LIPKQFSAFDTKKLLGCDYAVQLFAGVSRTAVYTGLEKCEEKRGDEVTGRRTGGKEDVKGMAKEGEGKEI